MRSPSDSAGVPARVVGRPGHTAVGRQIRSGGNTPGCLVRTVAGASPRMPIARLEDDSEELARGKLPLWPPAPGGHRACSSPLPVTVPPPWLRRHFGI